ncbi:AAA family ATPase [Alkalibaculum sp. M08DMB]|uniref:AAA family ATPase n=1 Tax=Alkalibaculum sporogenes TaxID=2655001 RepID=A0A6A7KAG1_9FIRM|nr:UvrD-helicase domain-containing protein [Alkalibaculum sporogenes]MPW26434.1 AAA family ATPase [Alkalibaculum sporogenes]
MNVNSDNHFDDHIDEDIIECLNLKNPKSFFLFAGAGSGKTRSLVETLSEFKKNNGKQLRRYGKRVAIITYTNAACEEIKSRLEYDSLFSVSTIHSFIWDLIKNFQSDIKDWLTINLKEQIKDLELQNKNGRSGTKTAINREKSIESKKKRLENLKSIKSFIYNPNGDNRTRDSLNHSEVINIGASFLNNDLMQKILIKGFPILLIDESQDTNKNLMNAFLLVQKMHSNEFLLGLFGDTMQRIYNDGKVDLGIDLPEDWMKPAKIMNHRCPPRIVKLINKIRSSVDQQQQRPRADKKEGTVRLFLSNNSPNKDLTEKNVTEKMAIITNDSLWCSDSKTLILEHHMAASRMGFIDLFEPLYKADVHGLLDGSIPELRFFTQLILPIKIAKDHEDQFSIARIARTYSNLMSKQSMSEKKDNQLDLIQATNEAVSQLLSLWENNNDPLLIDILKCVAKTNLFNIPHSLYPIVYRDEKKIIKLEDTTENGETTIFDTWEKCLSTPFSQIIKYDTYTTDQSNFATHQGVKGLEFPRVIVIIDDSEAKGFSFSYERLFGAKEKTTTDLKNIKEGKETSIERTRRLFYVTCSRAKESLAIVAYSSNPEKIKKSVLAEKWFDEKEIEFI